MRKTYFLCPNWDYHPDGGPVQLGNIIISPDSPADALNDPHAPRPTNLFTPATKTGVTWSTEKFRSGRYGIWTEFLSMITGIGADIAYEHSSDRKQTFVFDSLETHEFSPSQDFVEKALAESPAAVEFLNRSRLRRHLYMITAVKIARGAEAKTKTTKSKGGELKISAGGALTGAPMTFGPEIRGEFGGGESSSFEGSSPFVFAFRLRRIVVKRSGQVTQADYAKGAMFKTDEAPLGIPLVLEVDGVAEQDASVEEFRDVVMAGRVLDDYDEVFCVKPESS